MRFSLLNSSRAPAAPPWILLALVFPAAAMNAHAQPSPLAPDLILVNAVVRTMDSAQPQAEAVAIAGNRIAAVGSTAEIEATAGPGTLVIDAGGRLVLPGFNDAHLHFLMGGFQLSSVELRDADTPEEFVRRIGEFAKTVPEGRWVTGGRWDHELWPDAPLPAKEWIDPVTPDVPVFVSRLDGHMALANSLALKLAGVTRETPDPPGGEIVRDERGEPTGVLRDAAMSYVNRVVPRRGFDEKLAAAKAATDFAASLGVTSAQDMSSGTDIGLFQTLREQGRLKTRIYAVSPLRQWERLGATGIRAPFGDDMLRAGGLKDFSDGSLGSTTALFFDPYDDAPDTRGLQMADEDVFLSRVSGADRAGLHVMIHAIGDRANEMILDVYKRVAEENGERDRRFRVEHAQHLRPSAIARFGSEKVIASMQPYHVIDDGRWAEKRIGKERLKGTYAFRSLLDAGAVLAFGSDWTVAPLNPMEGIYAAVTRRTLDDANPGGWIPEQKITVEEAVYAYTVAPAYAEFAEKEKGVLARGKLADLVMLDRDIFAIDPNEIRNVQVLLTIVDGRVVFEKAE